MQKMKYKFASGYDSNINYNKNKINDNKRIYFQVQLLNNYY